MTEKHINCTIPDNLKERLEAHAQREMTSQATVIRQSLDNYCGEADE